MNVAFVTVGQAPRDDLVPELLSHLRTEIPYSEFGALDDLGRDEIGFLAPSEGEARLCTRLRDGTEVVTSRSKTAERLNGIFARLDEERYDLIVLLCTGYFDGLSCRALFIESQRLVDGFVASVAHGGKEVGILVPLAEQIVQHDEASAGYAIAGAAHASPYSDGDLEAAARELSETDLIVMHCMGYTEEMRRRVAAASGKPVILSRRIVAAGMEQFV